jgi:hypothetical protein
MRRKIVVLGRKRLLKSTITLLVIMMTIAMISSGLSANIVPSASKNNSNEIIKTKDSKNNEPVQPITETTGSGRGGRGTPIFTEGFEGYIPPGPATFPPTGWVIYDVGDTGRTWELYDDAAYAHSGTSMARCPYDYSSDAPNDDWLVTTSVVIPPGGSFSFYAAQYIYGGPEAFQVYYSTTGNTVDDFIVSGTLLADTSVSSMVPSYTLFSYDMSDEQGETGWFAIRYIGNYEWYLFVDDVTLPDGTVVDFEGTPASGWPPAGWSVIQTNTDTSGSIPGFWSSTDYDKHTGNYAAGLWWSYDHQDEWLITPDITLTGASSGLYYLLFWTYGWEGSIYGDHYYVKISTNGGTSWDVLLDLSDLTRGDWNAWDYPYEIDLSAYADETIKLAWHAIDVNDPGDPNYPGLWYAWIIDDIEVGYTVVPDHDVGVTTIFEPKGTQPANVFTPKVRVENFGLSDETDVPVNMQITSFGGSNVLLSEGFEDYIPGSGGGIPATWTIIDNDADGYQWEGYNLYPYEGNYHARIHWHSGGYCDDWLITPMVHVPAGGDTFEFYARAYSASYAEDWEVWITTTGTTVNDFLVSGTMIGSGSTTATTYSLYSYVIPGVYLDTDAWIAIRCISYDAFYLFVDAISMPNLGFFEGFEGTPSSGFPPAGWTHEIVSGTDTDNEWDVSDGTSTHPTGIIPHSGSFMTQYDSYFIASGNSARLYTPALNFAAAGSGTFTLRFWMFHDTGYLSSNDRVDIQASTDGSIWTTLTTVARYNTVTGWTEHTVDLSAYTSDTTVYIGFLGISEYGNSIYVDDITIEKPGGAVVEYDETVTIDLLSGQTTTVWFPDWTPADLKTTAIDYALLACADLDTDQDRSNDCAEETLTLLFVDFIATMIIEPEPIYAYYAFAIDPIYGTIYLGDFLDGHTAGDVDCTSILVNGFITPTSCVVLPSHPDFEGSVVEIVFPLAPFINYYMPFYDTAMHTFFVTGEYNTGKDGVNSFETGGIVTMRGHTSGDISPSGTIDVSDVVYLVNYIFLPDSPDPDPLCVADVDGNRMIDISDAVYLIKYIFGYGPAPVKDCCENIW